jgi:hypothetical protein
MFPLPSKSGGSAATILPQNDKGVAHSTQAVVEADTLPELGMKQHHNW